jgi:hypothetical protein
VGSQKVSVLLRLGPLKSGELSLGSVQATREKDIYQSEQSRRCLLLNTQLQQELREQEKLLANNLSPNPKPLKRKLSPSGK